MDKQDCGLAPALPVHFSAPSQPRDSRLRRTRGNALVEAAGAIALLLPILLLVIFAITQVSQYFVLKQEIAYVARQAAKELAYAYGTQGLTSMNSGGTTSGAAATEDSNYKKILNAISVPGTISKNSSTQFNVFFNIPNSPSLTKSYVTASVTYKGGGNQPSFPWNPLNGSFLQFDMSGVTVKSSCSWPIPHS